ncbi:MAG: GH25 family lysozyme [Chloroflexota bacterium]
MRAQLLDLSKWNVGFAPAHINAQSGALVDGVILRSSYGLMPDRSFSSLYQASLEIPVRGAYHYLSSGSPWEQQAQFFLDLLRGKDIHFFVLDVESAFNHKSAGFALAAQRWLEYVAGRVNRKVLLYTNPYTYNTWLSPYGDWMGNYELWVAQYPYRLWNDYLLKVPTDVDIQPLLPKGRDDWRMWQYSADGNTQGSRFGVASRDVDLNVFNGSVAELHAWAQLDKDIPDPQTQPPDFSPVLDDMQQVIDKHRQEVPA